MPFLYSIPPAIYVDDKEVTLKYWFADAQMLKDGTILMDVREEMSNGDMIEGRDVYKPTRACRQFSQTRAAAK